MHEKIRAVDVYDVLALDFIQRSGGEIANLKDLYTAIPKDQQRDVRVQPATLDTIGEAMGPHLSALSGVKPEDAGEMHTQDYADYAFGEINHTIEPDTEYKGRIIRAYDMEKEYGKDAWCGVLALAGTHYAIEFVTGDPATLWELFDKQVLVVLGDHAADDTHARWLRKLEEVGR